MSRYLRHSPKARAAALAASIASLAFGAFGASGCRSSAEDAPAAAKPTVKVLAVKKTRIEPSIPIAGVLAPLPGRDVKVGSLVQGRVDRMFVAEGDPVKSGQVLAHVEAGPLKERLAETEAQRAQATSALENARTRLARTELLFKNGIAAKQEVDDAQAAAVAAESAVKQARAAGGTATVQLDRATLRSPIDGVVAAILVPAGQPVDGNGTPIIEVADTRILDLRAPIPAGRATEVKLGQLAELAIGALGTVTGTVAAISPLVDAATNTLMTRIRIKNPDGRLRGGAYARGLLKTEAHEGFAIPKSALLPSAAGDATSAAIVDPEGKITHRDLEIGDDDGDRIEVRKGLVDGDRVVIEGGYSLPDGTAVEVAS